MGAWMRFKRPTVNDLNTLGVQFYRAEAYDLAIVQLEQAVRLAPRSPAIHFNLVSPAHMSGVASTTVSSPGTRANAWRARACSRRSHHRP